MKDSTDHHEEKMIRFLEDPGSYLHKPASVQILHTHASILSIAPPYVFKIKKMVDLGFLNFKSLKERKANAEREFTLNSRLCKELYVGIVPIFENKDGFSFKSGAKIIDYALQMNRLKDGFFLNQLLQKGEITVGLLNKILMILKNFYNSQESNKSIKKFGKPECIKESIDQNFSYFENTSFDFLNKDLIEIIRQNSEYFFRNNLDLFTRRIHEDKIKDCHGDLHLDHIHYYNNKVCIYDCIEFNDRFRYIDIASDIAFLAMDFDFYERQDLAQYVASRFSKMMQDQDILNLMDFYKSYRAAVRTKVEAIKYRQRDVPDEEKEKSLENAIKYFKLSLRYSVIGSAPFVFLIGGRPGSGKSTLATQLAEVLGLHYISSDIVRKTKAEVPLYQQTSIEKKEVLYSSKFTEEVYQEILNQILENVKHQKSIVVDASFGSKRNRALFIQTFEKYKIPFNFIEAMASDETIRKRLSNRETEMKVISDARLEDFDLLNAKFEKPVEVKKENYLGVNTEVPVWNGILKILKNFR